MITTIYRFFVSILFPFWHYVDLNLMSVFSIFMEPAIYS